MRTVLLDSSVAVTLPELCVMQPLRYENPQLSNSYWRMNGAGSMQTGCIFSSLGLIKVNYAAVIWNIDQDKGSSEFYFLLKDSRSFYLNRTSSTRNWRGKKTRELIFFFIWSLMRLNGKGEWNRFINKKKKTLGAPQWCYQEMVLFSFTNNSVRTSTFGRGLVLVLVRMIFD